MYECVAEVQIVYLHGDERVGVYLKGYQWDNGEEDCYAQLLTNS